MQPFLKFGTNVQCEPLIINSTLEQPSMQEKINNLITNYGGVILIPIGIAAAYGTINYFVGATPNPASSLEITQKLVTSIPQIHINRPEIGNGFIYNPLTPQQGEILHDFSDTHAIPPYNMFNDSGQSGLATHLEYTIAHTQIIVTEGQRIAQTIVSPAGYQLTPIQHDIMLDIGYNMGQQDIPYMTIDQPFQAIVINELTQPTYETMIRLLGLIADQASTLI